MFTTFSLAIILDCTVRIVLGTALGALIGLERQLRARSARRALGCGAHHHVRLTLTSNIATVQQANKWDGASSLIPLCYYPAIVRLTHATVNVVRFRSSRREEWPMSSSNSPGSTMRLASGSTIVQFATGISKVTVLVSPGSSATRWNAFNSRSVQL